MIPHEPYEPFELQLEWLDHRYDPGHFLGGTIRPEWRIASLGWRAKRFAGILALAGGAATLVLLGLLAAVARIPLEPWSLSVGVLNLLAGFRLWKAAATQGPPRDFRAISETHQFLQATLMAVAGTALVAGLGAGILIVLAVSTAIAGRAFQIGAALFVVIAVVVLVRENRRLRR